MIVDITSGVKADGTLVARTGWIAIDNGAYTADAAFFPQLAAMHVAGPYAMEAVKIEASLVYTNHQPSGSVRAPTAPQACWALESHTDELAAVVGMDPVEFRRANIVDEGIEGAAGQVYGEIGLRRCLDAAVGASAYGDDLPDDEAVGVAIHLVSESTLDQAGLTAHLEPCWPSLRSRSMSGSWTNRCHRTPTASS